MSIVIRDPKRWLRDRAPADASGCWIWCGWCDANGYGKNNASKWCPERLAHRMAYWIFKGPIPSGMSVLHTCDVRACCNPDHLFLGTQDANMKDMIAKGRRASFKGSKHGQSKLTERDVIEIRRLRALGASSTELAPRFGVSPRTVRDAASGRMWSHVA